MRARTAARMAPAKTVTLARRGGVTPVRVEMASVVTGADGAVTAAGMIRQGPSATVALSRSAATSRAATSRAAVTSRGAVTLAAGATTVAAGTTTSTARARAARTSN